MAAKKKKKRAVVEHGRIPVGKKPKGGHYAPPYGQVHSERTGRVTTVVRKIFRPRLVDYFHIRVINSGDASKLESVEREPGGVLFKSDAATLDEALSRAAGWIAGHPMEAGI